MQKHITAAERAPMRVVLITLDNHLANAVARAERDIRADAPSVELNLHVAANWNANPKALEACKADIARGDIIIVTMLFLEEHIRAILPDLEARRDHCDAMVGCMSAGEVIRLTRLGRFSMGEKESGVIALLKKLRGSRKPGQSSGANQIAMLKRIPRLLRFIPGTAQDVRAYFVTMQYWLAGSHQNIAHMVRFLVNRYASDMREFLRGAVPAGPPVEYPETGVYHPRLPGCLSSSADALPSMPSPKGTVGLIIMRAYVLSGDTDHYDGVIDALEAQGFNVVPVFAAGLDARPAIEIFLQNSDGTAKVDAIVSLTGFSLVGGPAYNDASAAEETLASLDVPYISAQALEFQSLESWRASDRGLLPIEATMMVAIPELDGATTPMVYAGRKEGGDGHAGGAIAVEPERAAMLARRVSRLIALRTVRTEDRKVAVILFNFPPNSGGTGTAAFLSVYESLFETLKGLRRQGYTVDLPQSVDDLRAQVLEGSAQKFGTDANVHAQIDIDDHIRREPYLTEIEAQWGPAPGRQLAYGRSILIQGAQFGNVFVGVQPGFGYEGDPMRLLFEKGFAPTHAFSAFYRYIREEFGAHAVVHFGTHGALEFMPGKQVGMSATCWPDRLIADLPNLYLYASNNPSEGTIAKRRSGATLVSYLTPALTQAGLYKGLLELKSSIDRYRGLLPDDHTERERLTSLINEQSVAVDLIDEETVWSADGTIEIARLSEQVLELEYELIPHGLHIVGRTLPANERAEMLAAINDASEVPLPTDVVRQITDGQSVKPIDMPSAVARDQSCREVLDVLIKANRHLAEDTEVPALLHALEGRYVRPAPGGDLLRTPAVLPTGRNLHGFDPFRIPSVFAVKDGTQQADRLLARHHSETGGIPESIAMVLWGTDNLKTEGGPIAQALSLIGATPRFDSYGRLCGADLVSLDTLDRPRIDVLMTLSGIFRDLLPLQTRMLAEAAFLAAVADEPVEMNFVRKHVLAYQAANDCDIETAALRVFSNADGAYGSNVNHLIDSGNWEDEDELADVFSKRKCFAYSRTGEAQARSELMDSVLGDVELVYQNLESVEVGVTTIDHYFDTLGGIGRAVTRARGETTPVYIGDQTRGGGKVRTLNEQVALETRTRAL
ncbi:MAG: magnesium chelatase subunit H, partial [Pseudomonadota bacterium]